MELPPLDQSALNKSQVYEQLIAVTDRLGAQNQFPLWYFDSLMKDAVKRGIMLGVQFGASLILFLVLVLLSKHEKRRSPVFVFNIAALFGNAISALLQCCIVTSSLWDVYPNLVGDYVFITPAANRLPVVGTVFVVLVTLFIEASLVLQVYVISLTLQTWQKIVIFSSSIFVGIVAMGFRIAQSAVSIKCTSQNDSFCTNLTWLAKAKDISLTVSICFFSAIFCAKLGWSLRERRKLGMKRFGSMQIIFIGSFQTMFIPAIFSIIQFINAKNIPNIGSNVLTATCISLPLTSIWASAQTASPSKAARGHDFHRKFLVDSSTADSTARKPSDAPQWPASQLDSRSTARDRYGVLNSVESKSEAGTWDKPSPSMRQTVGVRDVERDLEMQELRERD